MMKRETTRSLFVGGCMALVGCTLLSIVGVRAYAQRGGGNATVRCVSVAAGAATMQSGMVINVGQSVVGRIANDDTILTLGGLSCLFETGSLCSRAGDQNGDAHVNLYDFARFTLCFSPQLSPSSCLCADLNGDEVVDLLDLALLIEALGAR